MHGLLADSPKRFAWPCLPSWLNSEINSLVLPLLLAPKTAKSAQIVLVGLPAPSVKTLQRDSQSQDLADQVLGREDPAGTLAGEEQSARVTDHLGRVAGTIKVELPDDPRRFEHFANQGKAVVFGISEIHQRGPHEHSGKGRGTKTSQYSPSRGA